MKKGFTLIELIVVVSVIAVLAGMVIPTVGAILDDAKEAVSIAEAKNVATAVLQYEKKYGYLPYNKLPGGRTGYAYAYSYAQVYNLGYYNIKSYLGRMLIYDPWKVPYKFHQYDSYNPPARAVVVTFGKDRASNNKGYPEWSGTTWSLRRDIRNDQTYGGYYTAFK